MNYSYADRGERRRILTTSRNIVVKVGSNLLRNMPAERTEELIGELARLRNSGYTVTLVTSGAIPVGMGILGKNTRPRELAQRQALAALGQCYLMQHYDNACEKHGFHCAQLLLTAADLKDRERNAHVTGCLRALHAEGVLPIINENDSVCVDEIKIGDNDTLAAYVAAMVNADLTILRTTIDGFRETNADGSLGQRISVITELDDKLLAMAGSTDGNQFSTGGMITKLHAASISMTSGHALAIIDGTSFSVLTDFFAGKDIGTLFNGCSSNRPMRSWQRFLAFFSQPKGELFLDAGAANAVAHNNRSLLPSGVLGLRGAFEQGDTVSLIAPDRTEIARGIVNFAYFDLARICGVKSSDIAHILGHPVDNPEAVHKDYMVLTGNAVKW